MAAKRMQKTTYIIEKTPWNKTYWVWQGDRFLFNLSSVTISNKELFAYLGLRVVRQHTNEGIKMFYCARIAR